MKKVLLLLGLFSTGVSFAQSEEPKEEWREIIEPFTENVQMFGSLEREKIPYGILSDYAIETANLKLYDGKHQADSIVMDRTVLAEIYRTLQMGNFGIDKKHQRNHSKTFRSGNFKGKGL